LRNARREEKVGKRGGKSDPGEEVKDEEKKVEEVAKSVKTEPRKPAHSGEYRRP